MYKIYNISEFGAIEGEDCTEAFKKAIEVVSKNEDILRVPCGLYLLSETLVVPPNPHWQGVEKPILKGIDGDWDGPLLDIMGGSRPGPLDIGGSNEIPPNFKIKLSNKIIVASEIGDKINNV